MKNSNKDSTSIFDGLLDDEEPGDGEKGYEKDAAKDEEDANQNEENNKSGKDDDESEDEDEDSLQDIRDRMNALAASIKRNVPGGQDKKPIDINIGDIEIGTVDPEVGITPEHLKAGLKSAQEKSLKVVMDYLDSRLGAVQQQTQAALTGLLMAERFFAKNPDLEPYRPFVGMVWDRIVDKEPNINFGELFSKLEKEVRRDLRLGNRDNKQQDPALVKRRSSVTRPTEAKKTSLQSELDELKPGRR